MRSRLVNALLIVLMVLLRGVAASGGQRTDTESLFVDMRFERGFLLSYPDSARGRSVEAILNFDDASNVPVWRLCQWGTKYTLATARCVRDENGNLSYANDGKRVIVGRPDPHSRSLTLEVRGKAEYGTRPRTYGQSWPHLLVEQDAVKLYPLDELDRIQFEISLRLLHCTNHMAEGQFDPGLHAAQFQMFFIVKNINPASDERGSYYWFGVPFYDSRYEVPPAYMAKDAGKDDATGKFICTVDGKVVGVTALEPGRWLTVQADLLPQIRNGLQEAVKRGYLKSYDPHDYAVANMNLGWEIPGTFDAAIEVKGMNVLASPKPTVATN